MPSEACKKAAAEAASPAALPAAANQPSGRRARRRGESLRKKCHQRPARLHSAPIRLEGARIADSLGISGKDMKEKLANTGTTIKSLASLALQGAQLMSGQGAITQGERQLASDAMSGKIDFTPAELRQLANAAKRSGEFIYSNYESQLKSMSQDPDFKKVMPYYQVPRMPQQANPNQLLNAADKIINGG